MKSALQFLTLLAALCCCFAPVHAQVYEYVVVGQSYSAPSTTASTTYYGPLGVPRRTTTYSYQPTVSTTCVNGVCYSSPAIVSRSYSYQPAYTPSYSQYSYPVQSYSQPSYYSGGYGGYGGRVCVGGVCY